MPGVKALTAANLVVNPSRTNQLAHSASPPLRIPSSNPNRGRKKKRRNENKER